MLPAVDVHPRRSSLISSARMVLPLAPVGSVRMVFIIVLKAETCHSGLAGRHSKKCSRVVMLLRSILHSLLDAAVV